MKLGINGNVSSGGGDIASVIYKEGINVDELIDALKKTFPKNDPRPKQFRNILEQIQQFHKTLYEWKELHNAINEIQIDFEPFRAEIDRATFSKSITKLSTLQKLWHPVSLDVSELSIKSIGMPFKILEDKSLSGEEWAIQFSQLQTRLNEHLGSDSGKTSKKESDYPNLMQILAYQRLGKEIPWWDTLNELTSKFHNTGSHYMNTADKQLRETAQELYNLSNKALSNL